MTRMDFTEEERREELRRGKELTEFGTEYTGRLLDAFSVQRQTGEYVFEQMKGFSIDTKTVDPRTVRIYAPQIDPEHPEESREAIRRYVQEFVSDDPAVRARQLDRIVEEMSQMDYSESMLGNHYVMEHASELNRQGEYACYMQNLREKNPEYFKARFEQDPALEYRFDRIQAYTPVLVGALQGICTQHGVDTQRGEPITEQGAIEAAQQLYQGVPDYTLPEAEADAAAIAWRYAACRGEPSPLKMFLEYDDAREWSGEISRRAEDLNVSAYDTAQGDPRTRYAIQSQAQAMLGHRLDLLFSSTQTALLKENGLSKYDMLFIGGKPLSQLAARPDQEFDPVRADVMLTEALISGKEPVSVANLTRTTEGKLDAAIGSLVGKSVRPEPPAPHYSRFRRMFNWGPFKLPQPSTPEADHNREAERVSETNAGARETEIRSSIREKLPERLRPTDISKESSRERVRLHDMEPSRKREASQPVMGARDREPHL